MTRIALIGASGQLGRELARRLAGPDLVALAHGDLEVTDDAAVDAMLAGVAPDVVLNTTAFHAVDHVESEPARAYEVNALAPRHLARRTAERGALLVHFSTDFVFDGSPPPGAATRRPYREDDPPHPLSAYAVSKLAGEHFVRAASPRHVVVRSAGLFGGTGSAGKGGNFVEAVLRRAHAGEALRVVDDQVTAPTFTRDVAAAVTALVERDATQPGIAGGIVHVTAAGECSWYTFARAILDASGLDVPLTAISSAELAAPARRPSYSVLENARLAALGIARPRHWREGLADYLRERNPGS
jgi:dTDP-4-dehydrorhamnose reductase